MSVGPAGELRPTIHQDTHWWPRHAIFEPQWRFSSPREANSSQPGFPHDVIGRILPSHPAQNGECRIHTHSLRAFDFTVGA